jgi:alpha-N-arabinofuranosidase
MMTEEINHSYDGGLYAELVQNRIFKDDPTTAVHWSVVQDNGGVGDISLDHDDPINQALTVCLKLHVSAAAANKRVGIANEGFWGIAVRPATSYRASFFAKSDGTLTGPLTVSLESNDGAQIWARAEVPAITREWKRYEVTLTTAGNIAPSATNRLVISTTSSGTAWFNLVSLFPPTYHDRANGNRPDIMQTLADLGPKFLRLPGGNFLEGDHINERFAWKQTIGPVSERPGHMGCWSYRASDGLGLLEFLDWCEDLHVQPVLAVYAGFSLKQEYVEPGPDLKPYVDDALDEIEYVTGTASTKWGARRAADGHPTPFPLTFVEVGNEDAYDHSKTYDGRFAQFYDAIKARYPHLQLIATTKVTSRTPDLFDDHFYRKATDFEGDTHHYDKHDRNGPKIFVGEWATTEGKPTPNMNAALGDAAWMTGLERNSDLVVMASYAPLLTNVNPHPQAWQWGTNLIGYDALSCYGSPSYYAQQMFYQNVGDVVLSATMDGIPTVPAPPQPPPKNPNAPAPKPKPPIPQLHFVVTRDTKKGVIYLKMVNTQAMAQLVQIELNDVAKVAAEGVAITLSSTDPHDTNTIVEPKKIIPITTKIPGLGTNFTYTFAPYSITVLQIPLL